MEKLRNLLDEWEKVSDPLASNKLPSEILDLVAGLIDTEPDDSKQVTPELWHRFLNATGNTGFVRNLPDRAHRYRWADTASYAIRNSGYTLLDMFEHRCQLNSDHTLFQDMASQTPVHWTYRQVRDRVHDIAAAFYHKTEEPRVAILCENSVDSACCDLACLMYDILVTPLNVHSDVDSLTWIFDLLGINIVVTDNESRLQMLEHVAQKTSTPFTVINLSGRGGDKKIPTLPEACLAVTPDNAEKLLKARRRRPLDEVATVMFTSGSTGRPKGVSFSLYNLVTKRFARSAALPEVGDDEVLLCYLPLYHTFGRYFEMLGMIYWSGTYIFPGNPSVDTLMALFKLVNPTGLISVPIRWMQIYERSFEPMGKVADAAKKQEIFRSVVGKRLRWGLSAAGYLAPGIFRFFNRNGVNLCSGFGMTEATGGITMTPPGKHVDNSIGIPLPRVKARLSEQGEFQIAGDYIGRYYDEAGIGDTINMNPDEKDEYWLPTGDLFRELGDGHYEIVDRLKDIYKNSRGQTIAPRKCEKKLEGVAGVKRSFLVGDAREYNVLLIVPDSDDPVVRGLTSEESQRDYYNQIVTNANRDLAPFERVINFAIIDRDFDIEKGELTPKGSFRRKEIEKNFSESVEELYRSKYVEFKCGKYDIKIPHWFIRDMGVLEGDVVAGQNILINNGNQLKLRVESLPGDSLVIIGDLVYNLEGSQIDLGLMARQPRLWVGNPSLIKFAPCREGWDRPMGPFSVHVRLPHRQESTLPDIPEIDNYTTRGQELSVVNQAIKHALFGDMVEAALAVRRLGVTMADTEDRVASVIRRRLEALAYHPELRIRSLAYRTLLLDKPSPNYGRAFPAFIESGKAFLDEESMREIASTNLSRRRLQELRQRLYAYRTQLSWPASNTTRGQFGNILRLLTDFALLHPEYYNTVRSELAGWILHKSDPQLAELAEDCFSTLSKAYEQKLCESVPVHSQEDWDKRIIFGNELTAAEITTLREVLVGTSFLEESIVLAFDEDCFDLTDIPEGGIWISRIVSRRRYLRYRVSVNSIAGKHYDLQVILNEDIKDTRVLQTIYWLMTISRYPHGSPVLPRLGCCRLELGARSLVYHGDLDVWEKVREFSSSGGQHRSYAENNNWRKLFVQALGAFFKGWWISGKRIVPGTVSPENIMVPQQDFREGALILSLTGWQNYEKPLSLVGPMLCNFFDKTMAHYPRARSVLDVSWIFDACLTELGMEEARVFLFELRDQIEDDDVARQYGNLREKLRDYLSELKSHYYLPLPLQNATDRFHEWSRVNPQATKEAREQIILELYRLYRLDRLPEQARYWLYRQTFFQSAATETKVAFDRLLRRLHADPEMPAIQLIELSDLQATLTGGFDRQVFSRLIFPQARSGGSIDILTIGDAGHKHVILRTTFTDRRGETYEFREPIEPSEIGQLYRLFFKEGYPKTVSERDRFLVVADSSEQFVGGLCYRDEGDGVVHLDGSVIAPSVMGRGIGSALVEDFCTRMTNAKFRVAKTHFFLRRFYSKRGFAVDRRWGALVRFLSPESDDEDAQH